MRSRPPSLFLTRSRIAVRNVTAAALIVAMMMGVIVTSQPVARADDAGVATRLVVQDSPLAGFRYHEAPTMFSAIRAGDALDLVREPANPHDGAAIRVEWRGHMLGYVPRSQNQTLAWALDRGERVRARVSRLLEHPNPRERVRFEVFIE